MQVGDPIPLYLQSFDCNIAKYVRVWVRDENNTQITGSPVNLNAIGALGLYGNKTLQFPATPKALTVQYIVYDDPSHTVLSTSEGATSEQWSQGANSQWVKVNT